ncbi:MAG: NAD(P)-dependent alcohol dehydrogenase [Candidatus Dadabacteria bacterium]|nr:MAG: NAD(P)-dependent alcohol dehydrogenase [Candidatus Dadabacteria bacterium]
MTIRAYAASEAGAELKEFEYDPGELDKDDVELEVLHCGICHSDLSMLNNDWEMTEYPFVPGHEVVGRVVARGENVKHINEGDLVGLGWYSKSCMHCEHCLAGDHNHCSEGQESTIVGRYGGFADRVRCHWSWAIKLPQGIDPASAGPLFCGGITVFNPLVQLNVRPTDRVGVIGIGGLGHLALQFCKAWGCHVTAFTSSESKAEDAVKLGAHRVVNSRDENELLKLEGSFDLILSTVNVNLNWELYINALRARGKLHTVGAVPDPIPVAAFPMIAGQKSLSGTPLGSPATILKMLEFCERHNIAPQAEHFPMSNVNEALSHLKEGKARYRIVLDSDWK